jgi:hypothetical protein
MGVRTVRRLSSLRLEVVGNVCLVQLPHPGPEPDPGADGIRPWRYARRRNPHRRMYLQSAATYRYSIDGPDSRGDVAFWGEWEGEAEVIREFPDPRSATPKRLWRPNPRGVPPAPHPTYSPQNTDPFVWGDAIVYTACRQDRNEKLRRLGRGSVILFGSSLQGGFVIDTVLVVAGYVDHNLGDRDFRKVLADIASPEHMRMTLEPWYGGGVETTFRYYVGATPEDSVNGMFSYVPCIAIDTRRAGFARPTIELGTFIKPRLSMAARTSKPLEIEQITGLWRRVTDQVLGTGLGLGTHFDLPVA